MTRLGIFLLTVGLLADSAQGWGLSSIFSNSRQCQNGISFSNAGIWSHFIWLPICPESLNINFRVYTREQTGETKNRYSDTPTTKIRSDRRTIFVIHGWRENNRATWMREMKDDLLKREDANVITIDWSAYSTYTHASSDTRAVAAAIKYYRDSLKKHNGVRAEDTWCIGFSLGAQACGLAGNLLKFGRLTGLDPPDVPFSKNVLMYRVNARCGINPNSGNFVDVYITSNLGHVRKGHVDIYMNGGWSQPGCHGDVACEHFRSFRYFISTINTPHCLAARKQCTNNRDLPGSCTDCNSGAACLYVGYEAGNDVTKRGMYYVSTATSAPYCN